MYARQEATRDLFYLLKNPPKFVIYVVVRPVLAHRPDYQVASLRSSVLLVAEQT